MTWKKRCLGFLLAASCSQIALAQQPLQVPNRQSTWGGAAAPGGPVGAAVTPPAINASSLYRQPAARQPTEDASLPKLIATRQGTFAIPFSVAATGGQPAQVVLYVSADRGQNWRVYARETPDRARFQFNAPRDGEFWFTSRTLDAQNREWPQQKLAPELRVLVDTAQPQIKASSSVAPTGEVLTTWQIADPQLKPDSFRLEYQDAPGSPWRTVPVGRHDRADGSNVQGSLTWRPETSSQTIVVRLAVRDAAGNASVRPQQLFLPEVARRQAPEGPAAGRPSPGAVAWDAGKPDATSGPLAGATAPQSVAGSSLNKTNAGGSGANESAANGGAASFSGATTPSSAGGTTPSADAAGGNFRQIGNRVPIGQDYVGNNGALAATGSKSAANGGELPAPDYRRDASTVRVGAGGQALQVAQPVSHRTLPDGITPQITNSRRFRLDYDVSAAGPQGVRDVELWVTRDAGRQWTRFGTDEDRQSPYEVLVTEEGVYGFRVVIVGNNGLSSAVPRSGDAADIWVAIDTTRPTASIISTDIGQGADAGQLLIRWKADDLYLGPQPITLEQSQTQDGPWTVIAANLPNTGRHNWTVTSQHPTTAFIRMLVRDQAGNVHVSQTPRAISLQQLAPQGRIRNVNPVYQN